MLYTKEFKISLEKFLDEKKLFYKRDAEISKGLIKYILIVEKNNKEIPFNIIVKDLFITLNFLDFMIVYKAYIETIEKIVIPEDITEFFNGNIKFKIFEKNLRPLKLEVYKINGSWKKIITKRKFRLTIPNSTYEFSIEDFKKVKEEKNERKV